MHRELKHTIRFFDHVRDVTLKHFEFRLPEFAAEVLSEDHDIRRCYYKDAIIEKPNYSDLTQHQKYLHDLGALVGPVIASYRIRNRLPRLTPRARSIAASSRLEQAIKDLAFESYHFKERIKLVSRSAVPIVLGESKQAVFRKDLGKIISSFDSTNERLLRYRNFIVHGPEGRVDEFSELRGWELGGLFYHSDLWADYNTAFWEAQQLWISFARRLISSMETSLMNIQSKNEHLIADGSFDFLSPERV